jgi:hypothetical protein
MTTETYEQWLSRVQSMLMLKEAMRFDKQAIGPDDFAEFVKDRDFIPIKERDLIENIYLETLDSVSDTGRSLELKMKKRYPSNKPANIKKVTRDDTNKG